MIRLPVGRLLAPPHPTVRALTWAAISGSLAKGIFFSISALFFTRVIGLSAASVGVGLTVAGGVGVVASFAAGYLCDRVGADQVLRVATFGQGLALAVYPVARGVPAFVVTAVVAVGLQSTQRTAQATLLARCFTGPERVDVRARLRVVTNVFVGVGGAAAGIALGIGTASAYLVAMGTTAALVLGSSLTLRRLPSLPAGPGRVGCGRRAGRSPLRDWLYLSVTALNGVLSIQFGLLTVGVPLWVAGHTRAPAATVAVILVLNTVLVALFQVRVARRSPDVRSAGRAVAVAGVLLAVACLLYTGAAAAGVWVAVAVLLAAAVAHSFGEVYAESGGWTIAFDLADPDNAGAYQGVSQTGMAIGAMLAPAVITTTVLDHGVLGWAALGAGFAAAGGATAILVRHVSTADRLQAATRVTEVKPPNPDGARILARR